MATKDITITGIPSDFAQRLASISTPPAATPQAPVATEPTIAEQYKSPYIPQNDKAIGGAIDTGINMYGSNVNTPVDEDRIRRDTLNMFQQEIDATNRIYGEKLNEAKTQGISRLGSNRAIDARSGLLGSDFGNAHNENVIGQNNAIEATIRAENQAKIAEILGKARGQASTEIAAKRKAQEEGLDSYLKFLGAKTERKTAGLKSLSDSLIAQNISPDEIDPLKLKEIAQSYGLTEDEIKANFAQAKKTYDTTQAELKAKQAKENRITVNQGDQVYTLNPDGTYTQVANNPKTTIPGAGNKITLSEARTMGLPLSLVGQSENDIANSLTSEQPPIWFKEKAENEAQMNFQYDKLSELWNDYRTKVSTKTDTTDTPLF